MCTMLSESRATLLECEIIFVRSLTPLGGHAFSFRWRNLLRGVKNPREGSAEEISFPWDLRHGHGVGGGSA
jgi:hypothetical protein